ncbi:unnamed protein product [Rotaria magnacalcarata]|uniref:Uncharacterized protein n=4 Tax=Rotaria TaxID=231623 RepID=A0A815I9S0_9BILA|nr:unnamed protein product [Rotaria magnacalcarata]CAF3859477.1 unnamed protein product [Rotaria magnacalcarata]
MATGRNIVGSDVFDQNLEHVALLSNELLPSEYFTGGLAEFCHHAAYHCDIHSISMPIILLNVAATSTKKSGIWRSNTERFPLNLYSLLVGNSSFRKSKLLRLISHGLHVIIKSLPHKFQSSSDNLNNNFPVYNDATCAGIIASVNGCTRVLISEEADVLLPSIGAVLPSPFINKDVPAVKSEARVEMMKMFDGDFHMRKLKGGICKIDSFKHSFIGASSGGIIVTALQRKASGSQVGLFENLELFYDNDSDRRMVDFGNQHIALAYKQTDRYLMAKIGKTVQLTHRLVGLIQVLEWSWKIAAEYLRIYGCFTSSISEDFISSVRQIFKDLYGEYNDDKRGFMISMVSVEHGINISQALLEQYKIIMRLPDDPVRGATSNNNNLQSKTTENFSMNIKLEKSKLKFSEHVRGILLFKSVMFTSTTLYKSCSVFRHHSENVNSVLQELAKRGLIIEFKNGVVSATKKATVYVKWFPNINDTVECQRFEQLLGEFNDDQLSSTSVVSCTTTVSLSPHKAAPQAAVLNYLKSSRYARLNLDFTGHTIVLENSLDDDAVDEDSNCSSVLLEGSIKANELPVAEIFCGYDKNIINSTNSSSADDKVTHEEPMIMSNSIANSSTTIQESVHITDNSHCSPVDFLSEQILTHVVQASDGGSCSSKRKSSERVQELNDDDVPLRIRIRSVRDGIGH